MKLFAVITLTCLALTILAEDPQLEEREPHFYGIHHSNIHGHSKHIHSPVTSSLPAVASTRAPTRATATKLNPRRCFIDACPRGFLARRADAIKLCSRFTAKQRIATAASNTIPLWARLYCRDNRSLSHACSCVASGVSAVSIKTLSTSPPSTLFSTSVGSLATAWSGPSLTLPPEDIPVSTASVENGARRMKRQEAPCLPLPGLSYRTGGKAFRIICGADNDINSFHGVSAPNPKACADICAKQQGCVAASYTSACWLKDKLGVVRSSGMGTIFILPDTGAASDSKLETSSGARPSSVSKPATSSVPTAGVKNTVTQEQNPAEIRENNPSPPDSDRPEFTFVDGWQGQEQPDQNQQQPSQPVQNQPTQIQQVQSQETPKESKQDDNKQSQDPNPSEITENGPSPNEGGRPEFTFVPEDGQQDQQQQNQQDPQQSPPVPEQNQQNQEQSQRGQNQNQQQNDQGLSEIKENDPSPPDMDRPEFTFVQEDSPQHPQQTQQEQQQSQPNQGQPQQEQNQNQQQNDQGPSEIKENDPSPPDSDRPEFTFVQDDSQQNQQQPQQNQQTQDQSQQNQQQNEPQQSQSSYQTPSEIQETDPSPPNSDRPEFTFVEDSQQGQQKNQQGQDQNQQQQNQQSQQPQQSQGQQQEQKQNPSEIRETDPNRESDDRPEFIFVEGQFLSRKRSNVPYRALGYLVGVPSY